jgi:thiol-disulfide isomerase/thioredoxin
MKNQIIIKSFLLIALSLSTIQSGYSQVKIDDQAPAIELTSMNGEVIKLSDFAGKVVLIDFWASWCGPCRKANPELEKIYQKFKDKDFTILGVSLDSKETSWIAAIKKDKISYPQVIDVDNWNSKTVESYGIDKLPSSYLINKEGKIIALNPTYLEVEQFLMR